MNPYEFMYGHILTPHLLAYSVGAFVVLLLVHCTVWRLLKTRKHITWLFSIFNVFPTLVFLGGLVFVSRPVEWGLMYVLVFSISSFYVNIYPQIDTGSPTLVMIQYIRIYNNYGGLTKEQIVKTMTSDRPFEVRLRTLKENGLIVASDNEADTLSVAGRFLAAFFYHYRRVLKLPLGMG